MFRLKLWWSGPTAKRSLTYVDKDGKRHVVYEKIKAMTFREALGLD